MPFTFESKQALSSKNIGIAQTCGRCFESWLGRREIYIISCLWDWICHCQYKGNREVGNEIKGTLKIESKEFPSILPHFRSSYDVQVHASSICAERSKPDLRELCKYLEVCLDVQLHKTLIPPKSLSMENEVCI